MGRIQGLKVITAHVHLAPHFQQGRHILGQTQRNLPNGADVLRHVLTHLTIAARGGLHQHTLFVAQAHGQTVKLGLGHIDHRRCGLIQPQLASHPRVKILGTAGLGIGFCANAEHGHGVAHAGERVQRLSTDPLRGGVWRDPLGVLGFQGLQLLEQPVVLGVRNLRVIQHVIAVPVCLQGALERAEARQALSVRRRRG